MTESDELTPPIQMQRIVQDNLQAMLDALGKPENEREKFLKEDLETILRIYNGSLRDEIDISDPEIASAFQSALDNIQDPTRSFRRYGGGSSNDLLEWIRDQLSHTDIEHLKELKKDVDSYLKHRGPGCSGM